MGREPSSIAGSNGLPSALRANVKAASTGSPNISVSIMHSSHWNTGKFWPATVASPDCSSIRPHLGQGNLRAMSKALSVCQPWACAIIHGPKRIENRTRYTHHRGPLLIHASKSQRYKRLKVSDLLPDLPPWDELVFGALIGVVQVVDCVPLEEVRWGRRRPCRRARARACARWRGPYL